MSVEIGGGLPQDGRYAPTYRSSGLEMFLIVVVTDIGPIGVIDEYSFFNATRARDNVRRAHGPKLQLIQNANLPAL